MEFNYEELSRRTNIKDYRAVMERMGENAVEVLESIRAIKNIGNECDKIKKRIFYGKETPVTVFPYSTSQITHMTANLKTRAQSVNIVDLYHGVVGLATEVAELAEALEKAIEENCELDLVNIGEELGDTQWYAARIADVANTTIEKAMLTNIAKLKARYPNEFTEEDAINRNLDMERDILNVGFNETK